MAAANEIGDMDRNIESINMETCIGFNHIPLSDSCEFARRQYENLERHEANQGS
jgi:hypothetical protein